MLDLSKLEPSNSVACSFVYELHDGQFWFTRTSEVIRYREGGYDEPPCSRAVRSFNEHAIMESSSLIYRACRTFASNMHQSTASIVVFPIYTDANVFQDDVSPLCYCLVIIQQSKICCIAWYAISFWRFRKIDRPAVTEGPRCGM